MSFSNIYAVVIPGEPYLKIGITQDPKKRLQCLQTSYPRKIRIEILLRKIPYSARRLVDDAIKRFLRVYHVTGEGGGTEFYQIGIEELRKIKPEFKRICKRVVRQHEKQTNFEYPLKVRRQTMKRPPTRIRSKPKEWWKV